MKQTPFSNASVKGYLSTGMGMSKMIITIQIIILLVDLEATETKMTCLLTVFFRARTKENQNQIERLNVLLPPIDCDYYWGNNPYNWGIPFTVRSITTI